MTSLEGMLHSTKTMVAAAVTGLVSGVSQFLGWLPGDVGKITALLSAAAVAFLISVHIETRRKLVLEQRKLELEIEAMEAAKFKRRRAEDSNKGAENGVHSDTESD